MKQSSSKLSTEAAKLMAMDDDEMRKFALRPEHQEIPDDQGIRGNDTTYIEPRLTPEFCQLVRSICASVVSQDETKGQG